jgi:type VI secretion system secreted protein Hcp
MAVDYFLKLDGIKGESKDSKHRDEIDVQSWAFGLSQPATLATGGASTGKAQFQDLSFTKLTDQSSPVLFLKCANGAHIKDAVLTARKSGESQFEFLEIKLNDVLVSAYQTSASSELPTESISLNFAQIVYTYIPQNEDGSAAPAVRAGWDLRKNEPI